jgi:hypothetical protein
VELYEREKAFYFTFPLLVQACGKMLICEKEPEKVENLVPEVEGLVAVFANVGV